jgi:short-subunit dehydrogenase
MKVDRDAMAPRAFWLKAEDVVADSLEGLRTGRLLVIPSRRYRYLVALFTKLPVGLRLAIESRRKSPKAR